MSTTPLTVPLIFNAINGQELIEKILRDVRKNLEKDERFRHHCTYPCIQYKFSLSMKYEPGMAEAVNLSGHADARSKIEAQEAVIVALRKQLDDRDEKFHGIEAEAGLMISDLEKTKRDLADANEFINKLMAEKHAQQSPDMPAEQIFDLEALAKGEPIVVEHESEVFDEPDRLRESGETLNPDTIEIEVGGEGEAQGEAIPQLSVVGRQPNEVRNLDPALRMPTEGTGAVVSSGRPPAGVKGRPRG